MNKKTTTFTTARKNIETDIVRNEIKLLREYARISDAAGRKKFMSRFHPIMRAIVKQAEYTPDELIARLERAIKLNKYRPRNMSLFMLATSPDLYHIHGEFDTFDLELSQMFHETTRDDAKIRDKFNAATLNRFDLAKQVIYEWQTRLEKYPEFVDAARNATPDNEILSYNTLLNLLTLEYCREYGLDPESVQINIIKDWSAAGINNISKTAGGFTNEAISIRIPSNISKSKRNKIIDEFSKAPSTHPNAQTISRVYLCLTELHNGAKIHDIPFFDYMIASFAHEIQHVTDRRRPRRGALGPQVAHIDRETYVESKDDLSTYYKSATERSAYTVTDEMIRYLKNQTNDM